MQVRSHSSVAEIAGAWDELADRAGAAPWLRPGWTEAWWRAFGRGRLEIVAVHDGRELVAVCPVETRLGFRAAAANYHSPTFSPLADGDAALEALAGALRPARAAMLSMRPLPSDGPELAALRAAAAGARCRVLEDVTMRSPFIELGGSFEEFTARRPPSKNMLKDIRRNRRGLEAEGEVAFEVHDGTEGLDALLEEGFAVEAAGWQGAAGSAIASRPETRRLYTDVARWAAERGWLRLAFLRVAGEPIAFEYCLLHDGVLHDLKGGYVTEWRRRGPGMVLALDLLRWCCEQGLDGLDLCGDADEYKLKWTDCVRDRTVLRVFPPTRAGLAHWAAWRHARPAATRALDAARTLAPSRRAA